jgi:SAM-dependent methyltransferase
MAEKRNLNHQISAFYNDYHRERVRQPDQWMLRHYWPSFLGRTLEVGGGTLHPERQDYAIVDLSLEALRNARTKAILGAVADGTRLPFKKGGFDTVACHDVLEHVVDPESFMAEICRVARQRIIIAGPNFNGGEQGNLDRRLVRWSFQFIFTPSSRLIQLENPHLTFDEHWGPDLDAVTAPNAAWVASQMQRHGFKITQMRTWEVYAHGFNALPVLRCLGPFMFVVGEKT